MGLILLFAVETFDLPVLQSDLDLLCNLLCPDPCSPGDLHRDLSHIFETCQRYGMCVNVCGCVGVWMYICVCRCACMCRCVNVCGRVGMCMGV